jgi:UDP-N-acetylmuramoylalanine--D-glutamate ligase
VAEPRPALPPGPFLIVGLARSGEAAALALRRLDRGATVIGADAGDAARSPALRATAERLSQAGVEVHLNASGDALAARAGTLIKSPGVPQHAPVVRSARQRGLPVLGELELAWRLLPNQFIAVTGTNGKTTTTEWIGHIHREAARSAAVAGNVGIALSSLVGRLPAQATVVCEASSFQLEDTLAFAPEAAVLLNLTPDHLDRHGSFEAYVEAKLRAFANQGNDDIAVAPAEFAAARDLGGCARRVTFGARPDAELSEQGGHLWWSEEPLIDVREIALPGAHNRHNAMAAAAVCLARGLEPDAVAAGLRTFQGVAHRLERVARRDGVSWVNDSKATNVASTLVALAALGGSDGGRGSGGSGRSGGGRIHLIAGGRGKQQDFSPLAPAVAAGCRAVYLIGEAAAELATALAGTDVPIHHAGDLEHAVAQARAAARPGETVLLSPACASYDQYRDFEDRGEHFRDLVIGS